MKPTLSALLFYTSTEIMHIRIRRGRDICDRTGWDVSHTRRGWLSSGTAGGKKASGAAVKQVVGFICEFGAGRFNHSAFNFIFGQFLFDARLIGGRNCARVTGLRGLVAVQRPCCLGSLSKASKTFLELIRELQVM